MGRNGRAPDMVSVGQFSRGPQGGPCCPEEGTLRIHYTLFCVCSRSVPRQYPQLEESW